MAVDPTTTGQPAGWSLGPLGAPSTSTTPLAPQPVMTPEMIKALRERALQLQQPPESGIKHWTQGLAELVRAIQGNREADYATRQEAANRKAMSDAYLGLLPPSGNPSTAGGAPAGASGGGAGGAALSSDPYVARLFHIESGGDRNATTGSNRGLAQFSPDLEAKYGLTEQNRTDPQAQENAVLQERQEHGRILRSALGRDPTPGEQYLMHQQGIAGGPALLTADPNLPAWRVLRPYYKSDAIAKSAVTGNLPADSGLRGVDPDRITAGQFSNYWKTKFESGMQPSRSPMLSSSPGPPAPMPPRPLAFAGSDTVSRETLPPEVAQGASTGAPPAGSLSPMVSAIAGQPGPAGAPPIPPADFKRQVAALEASKGPAIPAPAGPYSPSDFAGQAAALAAGTGGGVPAASPAAVQPNPAAQAPSAGPVPVPQPRPPGANAAMVEAIAGRPMPPPGVGGAPNPAAPVQVAQNGPLTSAPPMAPGGAPGGITPLMAPHPAMEQLRAIISDPRVPPELKAVAVQQAQQMMSPQSQKVPGGTVQFIPGTKQSQFIPEEVPVKIKSGAQEIEGRAVFDPATGHYHVETLLPDENRGGGTAKPGGPPEPNLSTLGGMQQAEVAQAGAKKEAETRGEATAKYYDSAHRGAAGGAMVAAQQKQNIDVLRQIAASKDFTPGALGELALNYQRLAATLGIDPESAAPRELFNQIAARVLADQFSGMKSMAASLGETGARIFKPMLDIEEKANITAADSLAGIQSKLDFLDRAGDLMMKWGDMADDYASAHGGKLDAGFDKKLRAEIAKARIPNIIPNGEKTEGPGVKAPTGPVSKTIDGKTYYQNPNGKWFDNPEFK